MLVDFTRLTGNQKNVTKVTFKVLKLLVDPNTELNSIALFHLFLFVRFS